MMGNAAGSTQRETEGEAAASAAISQAAAEGADDAFGQALRASRAVRVVRGESGQRPGGGLAAADDPDAVLVAGVLTLRDAQTAASDGAAEGIAAMESRLQPSARFACVGRRFQYDVKDAQFAAAAGTAAGVKAVALMIARNATEDARDEGLDPDVLFAAARIVARAGSLAVRVHAAPVAQSVRYMSLLTPLLGGSLPASLAAYHLLSTSSDAVRVIFFGGISLGILSVSSGLVAGALGSSPWSLLYCRVATFVSFVILWLLLCASLCSLFTDLPYWIGFGIVGVVAVFALAIVWLYHRW